MDRFDFIIVEFTVECAAKESLKSVPIWQTSRLTFFQSNPIQFI